MAAAAPAISQLQECSTSLQVMKCQHASGGFGGSERNDPHLLYTLSALQVLALYDKLDLINADQVVSCESNAISSQL